MQSFRTLGPSCLDDGRCVAIGDFTESGYAIVRSLPSVIHQSSMIFVTGMSYSRTHKHADDLSFVLYERGRFVFVDSGKYGYDNDKWRSYVLSAQAHNTISLENLPLSRMSAGTYGSALRELRNTGSSFVISGALTRPASFRQARSITYDPGRSLQIVDRLTSDSQQRYVSSLHLAPDLNPELSDTGGR